MYPSLIEIGSKTAEKNSAQTNKQTDRQTDRHYEPIKFRRRNRRRRSTTTNIWFKNLRQHRICV